MITVEEPTVVVVQDPPAPKVVEVQARGPQGPAGTLTVGSVVTGAEGSNVTVTNTGSQTAAVLNFTIPRGNTGNAGLAATITIGTVLTGAPGSAVTFTNVGTANAAVFNISIPRGDTGAAGSNAWAAITGKPTTIAGYGIVDAYANPMTTAADLTIGGAAGAPARLAVGANGTFLKVVAGALAWTALAKADVSLGNVDNTSDVNKPVSTAQQAAIDAAAPPGMGAYFARNSAPTGYLKANGAAVSRTTYAALFTAISTTFGVGDGSTTFNVPDLRGEFIRGWDDSRGIDAARAFGSAQGESFKNHTHAVSYGSGGASAAMVGVFTYTGDTVTGNSSTGGSETRPRNIALLACIKY
ncbi:Phage Tail Collar Domain protein [compost metagenome]